jgi:hypothetical protein
MINKNVQIIENKKLNKNIWDKKLYLNPSSSFFSLSWVLDILHPNWIGLVLNDYESFMPIPIAKKFGVNYIFQPKFIRSLSIFNENEDHRTAIIAILKETYSLVNINLDFELKESNSNGVFQKLSIPSSCELLQNAYSKNALRVISKLDVEIEYKLFYDAAVFIKFFKKIKNIKSLKSNSYSKLHQLINETLKRENGKLIAAFYKGEMIACGFFIFFQKQVYFMKGTVNKIGREKGAFYGLIDYVLQSLIGRFEHFDFVGSNDKGVAGFYKKFGAQDFHYSILKYNTIKTPIKQLANLYLQVKSQ